MVIFVSANNTGQGKTYSSLLLLESFAKKGYKVAAFKPIETGVKKVPEDGSKLLAVSKKLNPNLKNITIDDIVPVRHELPAAPVVSGKVDFDKIKEKFEKLRELSDVLIIEGAGGVLVPVDCNFFMIDFLKFFNANLFMVFGSKLGMINDFLLNRELLNNKKISYTWAINLFDQSYYKISHPYMQRYKPLFIQKDLDKITTNLLKGSK